ncbi:SHOCT domain-containing protein [Nocardioides jejuensis]|uniref:SHOCT domain-containing protein n=1 Tax=Nocardioides jejuensis TaxID=2502782 RepID=A0A4R1BYR2_9ACTN|nr:SHOCT domain-containing protein [Nocardioides jejuensis]TCJ22556.1 SHOCT domain-containing protein [Nocardioides jejuensis]
MTTVPFSVVSAADDSTDAFPNDLADDCPEYGQLPTYTSTDGDHWTVDCGSDMSAGGVPGFFVVGVLLVLILGVGGTIWRVSTARRMARDSGMNVGDATAMTLLDDDGLAATYLASNLRHDQPSAPAAEGSRPTAAQRLTELQQLLAQGLITQAEHDERRRAILDEL